MFCKLHCFVRKENESEISENYLIPLNYFITDRTSFEGDVFFYNLTKKINNKMASLLNFHVCLKITLFLFN